MIGVVVHEHDLDVVREFFELFKTPWERAVPGRQYRAVLVTDGAFSMFNANALLIYGSRGFEIDREVGTVARRIDGPTELEWKEATLPVYTGVEIFATAHQDGVLQRQGEAAAYKFCANGRTVWRIGYDLFDEVRYLLTKGQPPEHALTPTLELHIELLRHILIESNVPFVEIPPRPAGCDFICCLTHDVDFFGIRRHWFDRTMAGFLYRSSVGSLIDLARGRRSVADLGRNWLACCSLPFVMAGLLPDFWRPFKDYASVEDQRNSTFFLIPFEGVPGIAPDRTTKSWRAAPYGIADVREEVTDAVFRGSEIGLHGIDAWRDSDSGKREMREVAALTGSKTLGSRMHWLYFDASSPKRLENAGFDYDSTWGYNDAVGYRAGTSQAFRPIACNSLIELPMSIMDSALFSSGRLSLHPEEALDLCRKIIKGAKHFGGTLVVNWHDRSLAPERLLGRFYQSLLEVVKKGHRVWFAKCGEAVEWFRWRRSIQFRRIQNGPNGHILSFQITAPRSHSRGAVVRVHRPAVTVHESMDRMFNGTASIEFET